MTKHLESVSRMAQVPNIIGETTHLRKLAFTVEEAMVVLAVKRTFLYAKIKSGELRARKCGQKKTLILAVDIQEFLDGLTIVQPSSTTE